MRTRKFLIILTIFIILATGILPGAYAHEVEYVYLGGVPVGITMENPGLYVCGKTEVVTENGVVVPLEKVDLRAGDYLISVGKTRVTTIKDLCVAMDKIEDGQKVLLGVSRGGEKLVFEVLPAIDALTKSKKLGIIVQDGISGVGTLTYVKKDGSFGALGHSIGAVGEKLVQNGKIYNCKIIGVKYPRQGVAGELQGLFDKESISIGKISSNSDFGVFGNMDRKAIKLPEVRLGTSNDVSEGRAYIYTCVHGNRPEKYEIEIVKKTVTKDRSVKNLVIKVTDEKLLRETGGIVQGMSGSPIVQNGYLVGAVTHVFVNDSTMGYGLYIDNMI
ncbi:MAG: SpoIVB peptidase [Clostridia bacterium]|nr:SpoIVB peptidase [Clostridia bacterium]